LDFVVEGVDDVDTEEIERVREGGGQMLGVEERDEAAEKTDEVLDRSEVDDTEHTEFVLESIGMCWYGALWVTLLSSVVAGTGGVLVRPLNRGAGTKSSVSWMTGSGGRGRGRCRVWRRLVGGGLLLNSGGGERLGAGGVE
jgi:hypothetical protein